MPITPATAADLSTPGTYLGSTNPANVHTGADIATATRRINDDLAIEDYDPNAVAPTTQDAQNIAIAAIETDVAEINDAYPNTVAAFTEARADGRMTSANMATIKTKIAARLAANPEAVISASYTSPNLILVDDIDTVPDPTPLDVATVASPTEFASQPETEAGTEAAKAVAPDQLAAEITRRFGTLFTRLGWTFNAANLVDPGTGSILRSNAATMLEWLIDLENAIENIRFDGRSLGSGATLAVRPAVPDGVNNGGIAAADADTKYSWWLNAVDGANQPGLYLTNDAGTDWDLIRTFPDLIAGAISDVGDAVEGIIPKAWTANQIKEIGDKFTNGFFRSITGNFDYSAINTNDIIGLKNDSPNGVSITLQTGTSTVRYASIIPNDPPTTTTDANFTLTPGACVSLSRQADGSIDVFYFGRTELSKMRGDNGAHQYGNNIYFLDETPGAAPALPQAGLYAEYRTTIIQANRADWNGTQTSTTTEYETAEEGVTIRWVRKSEQPAAELLENITLTNGQWSSGTNATASITIDFVDVAGNTYPANTFLVAGTLNPWTGASTPIVYGNTPWAGSSVVGHNKGGTLTFTWNPDSTSTPNGLSAINVSGSTAQQTTSYRVDFDDTNYSVSASNVVGMPLIPWTVRGVNTADNAKPVEYGTEIPAGTLFSFPATATFFDGVTDPALYTSNNNVILQQGSWYVGRKDTAVTYADEAALIADIPNVDVSGVPGNLVGRLVAVDAVVLSADVAAIPATAALLNAAIVTAGKTDPGLGAGSRFLYVGATTDQIYRFDNSGNYAGAVVDPPSQLWANGAYVLDLQTSTEYRYDRPTNRFAAAPTATVASNRTFYNRQNLAAASVSSFVSEGGLYLISVHIGGIPSATGQVRGGAIVREQGGATLISWQSSQQYASAGNWRKTFSHTFTIDTTAGQTYEVLQANPQGLLNWDEWDLTITPINGDGQSSAIASVFPYSEANTGPIQTTLLTIVDFGVPVPDNTTIKLYTDIGVAIGRFTDASAGTTAFSISEGGVSNDITFLRVGNTVRISGSTTNGTRQWLEVSAPN